MRHSDAIASLLSNPDCGPLTVAGRTTVPLGRRGQLCGSGSSLIGPTFSTSAAGSSRKHTQCHRARSYVAKKDNRRWSPYGDPLATDGNRSQLAQARKARNQAETVAVDCDQLPQRAHGKEGVGASRAPEGSAEPRKSQLSLSKRLHKPPECGGYGAAYEAFRFNTGLRR
jgi:hypothetical protein